MRIFRWHTGLRHGRSFRAVSDSGYAQLDVLGPHTVDFFHQWPQSDSNVYEVRIWRDGAEFEESTNSFRSAIEAKAAIRQAIGSNCRVMDAF